MYCITQFCLHVVYCFVTQSRYCYGKVGINNENPQEALSVNGNIMVTGDVFKPSDYRLKRNFSVVNPASQLHSINKINMYLLALERLTRFDCWRYDYDIELGQYPRRERGGGL